MRAASREQLEGRFRLASATLADERFTTQPAAEARRTGRVTARAQHKIVRDQVAAQLILQAYLDQRDAEAPHAAT